MTEEWEWEAGIDEGISCASRILRSRSRRRLRTSPQT